MADSWTRIPKPTGANWTKIPKPSDTTTTTTYGLLGILGLTKPITTTIQDGTWTKIPKPTGDTWSKIPKPTS